MKSSSLGTSGIWDNHHRGSEMLIKSQDIKYIDFDDSLTDYRLPSHKFGYILANPPLGVEYRTAPISAAVTNKIEALRAVSAG